MRKITNGAGLDTTALVQGLIAQGNQFMLPSLYQITPAVSPSAALGFTIPLSYWVTDWESSLFSTLIKTQNAGRSFSGVFQRSVIKRDALTFEVGLQANTTKVSWAPSRSFLTQIPTGSGSDNPALDLYTQFAQGAFDNGCIRIWKGYLSQENPGDLDTYGTMELFLGRISEAVVAADGIEIELKGYLDMLDGQIPRQTIGPSNRQTNFGLTFTQSASGVQDISMLPSSPYPKVPLTTFAFTGVIGNPPQIFPPHRFAGETASIGTQGNFLIRDSDNDGTNNLLYLYKPLKTKPASGAASVIFKPAAPTTQSTSPGAAGSPIASPGFPYVPRPEDQF